MGFYTPIYHSIDEPISSMNNNLPKKYLCKKFLTTFTIHTIHHITIIPIAQCFIVHDLLRTVAIHFVSLRFSSTELLLKNN